MTAPRSVTGGVWLKAVVLYVRLRHAYKKHGVLPYSRRKTWGEAVFAERMRRV